MKLCELYFVGIYVLILAYISQCLDMTTGMESNDRELEVPGEPHISGEIFSTKKYGYRINNLLHPYERDTQENKAPFQVVLHLLKNQLRNWPGTGNITTKITTTTDKYTAKNIQVPDDNDTGDNKTIKKAVFMPWGHLTRTQLENLTQRYNKRRNTTKRIIVETRIKEPGAKTKGKKPVYVYWWFKRIRIE